MIAMLWFGIYLAYKQKADAAYNDEVQNAVNLSLIFEENALRSIGEVDKTLFYLRRIIESRLGTVNFHDLVQTSDILSEIIIQVAVIDSTGMMRASSAGPQPAKPTDLSDRPHYLAHVGAQKDFLFVSQPMVGRISGKWSVQFTRSFRNKDGSFGGVIVASLNPEHFTQFYKSIELGETGSISLIGLDGIVRATDGVQGRYALGQDISHSALMKEIRANDHGTFLNEESPNGQRRIVAYRNIRGHPLALSVSVAEQQVYADSNNELFRNSIIGACLTLVILAISVKGSRAQLRLRHAQSILLRSQRRALQKSEQLRLTLDNMSQGIMLVTKDFRIPILNQQAIRLLDLPQAYLHSPPKFQDLVAYQAERGEFDTAAVPEGITPLEHFTRRDNQGAMIPYERTRPDGTVLEVRTTDLPDGGFVRTFTDITRRREAQAAINRLASEDALTGLPNRRLFQQELEKCARALHQEDGNAPEDREGFALLCLDVDRFKLVNDTLGHPIGDRLLQAVAERLRKTVRSDNVAARLGGDEFAILLPRMTSIEQPEALAKRLVEILALPYEISGHHIIAGASIGIALAPLDGTDPDLLLKAADMALYAAKGAGRGAFHFFHTSMAEQIRVKRQIEMDLRSAIEREELKLHYQPLLNLQSRTISGCEALMRWQHPTKGLVPPSEFIAVAEETGLIVPLGAWAIKAACLQATTWPNNVSVAVNVSPIQFQAGDLVETVRNILTETGLPPHRLELEITETILMQESDVTIGILHELRALGVNISMDDFGTGYSSLSYLRSFPLSKIKIDRSFVNDLETAEGSDVIIRSVIDIAKTLGMTTTAEGVETSQQLDLLMALGCDEAQGYFFSKPVSAADLEGLMSKWSPKTLAA